MGAGADDGWQQVRDGAAVLQQQVFPVVHGAAKLSLRSVYDQRVQLLEGRFAALHDCDGAAAEVDAPGFQSSQRRGQRGERAEGREDSEESVYR